MADRYVNGLQELRPWAIAYYVWGIRGYNDIYGGLGVDNHLSYQAARLGKVRGGLESAEEHATAGKRATSARSRPT